MQFKKMNDYENDSDSGSNLSINLGDDKIEKDFPVYNENNFYISKEIIQSILQKVILIKKFLILKFGKKHLYINHIVKIMILKKMKNSSVV